MTPTDKSERTRRIAKNTLMLYIRTFITIIIGLYSSRLMLEALGIDNYGINAVVGSIVSFQAIITGALGNATSRYITYALGEGDLNKQRTVFATVTNAQIMVGIITVIFLEVIGLWFLNTTAEIPEGRMYAANWVFQCSILTTFIGITCVPYNATIIAHEHMSVYAYVNIIESFIKLGICFILLAYGGDRLILSANLFLVTSTFVMLFYAVYCRKKFNEARYKPQIERQLLKSMLGFSGWNLLNNTAFVMITQGVNMLINVYFGVAINATRGIAGAVNSYVQQFVGNFTTAFSPQITKSYAAKEYNYCYMLVNKGTKFTWYLMLIFIVPIFFEADVLLKLWLVQPPPEAALFLRFVMFESLAVASGQNLYKLVVADGRLKSYTIRTGLYSILIFPITWIAFSLGAPAWMTYPLFIFIFLTINIIRLNWLHKNTTYPWQSFLSEVLSPCLKITLLVFVLPLLITYWWDDSTLRFFILVPICIINTIAIIYTFGLNLYERSFVTNNFRKIFHNN